MFRKAFSDLRVGAIRVVFGLACLLNPFHPAAAADSQDPKLAEKSEEFKNPAEYASDPASRLLDVTLEAKLADHTIPNLSDTSGLAVTVHVPAYSDNLVGPTLRIRKGDLLRIKVQNSLDPRLVPPDPKGPSEVDLPHGFAVTNLHTHGLHVSPKGNGDNIYVEIQPGEPRQYEYQILPSHQAGTFWYHAHRHGSVAYQLTSGMAGALIVDDDLNKSLCVTRERVMVLQQMHGTFHKNSKIWSPDPYQIYDKLRELSQAPRAGVAPAIPGAVSLSRRAAEAIQENAKRAKRMLNLGPTFGPPQPDPTAADQEWLLVNGQCVPTLHIKGGDRERWRFIHAGIDDVINVRVVDEENCSQEMFEIAIDGITRKHGRCKTHNLLYPGYRWDVLFQAPKVSQERIYYLIDDKAMANQTLSGFDKWPNLIARICVEPNPGAKTGNLEALRSMDLSSFIADEYKVDISEAEVANRRWMLTFDFPDASPDHLYINHREFLPPPPPDRVVRLNTAEEWLIGSGTDLKNAAGHPFHIHVNPFQQLIYEKAQVLRLNGLQAPVTSGMKLTDLGFANDKTVDFRLRLPGSKPAPNALSVSTSATLTEFAETIQRYLDTNGGGKRYQVSLDPAPTQTAPAAVQMAIRDKEGAIERLSVDCLDPNSRLSFTVVRRIVDRIWRDTLMAPSGKAETIRMRFRDWTGTTVLHCHIVDHEDQGMMKNVLILGEGEGLPQESAGAARNSAASEVTTQGESVTAPDFTLVDENGAQRRLRDYLGKSIILVFYRGMGCVHCSQQLQAFAQIKDRIESAGVTLIAVSSQNLDELKRSAAAIEGEKLPFILLADGEHQVFRQYGCYGDEPLHGVFVIDPSGRLTWKSATAAKPFMNVELVLSKAAASMLAPR